MIPTGMAVCIWNSGSLTIAPLPLNSRIECHYPESWGSGKHREQGLVREWNRFGNTMWMPDFRESEPVRTTGVELPEAPGQSGLPAQNMDSLLPPSHSWQDPMSLRTWEPAMFFLRRSWCPSCHWPPECGSRWNCISRQYFKGIRPIRCDAPPIVLPLEVETDQVPPLHGIRNLRLPKPPGNSSSDH